MMFYEATCGMAEGDEGFCGSYGELWKLGGFLF